MTTKSKRPPLLAIWVALVVYALDLLTKTWAVHALQGRDPVRVVGDFVTLTLVRNPGAAFSFGTGSTWVITILVLVIVAVVCWQIPKAGSRSWAVALGLILGGGLGNLTDRFFRSPGPGRGHVVDFVDVGSWPVFNVADMAVVCGGALIALLVIRDGRAEPSQPKPEDPAGPTGPAEPANPPKGASDAL